MTVSDIELRINEQAMTYGPFSYGSKAGQPTVDVVLSLNDDNAKPVTSIESQFANWDWKRKLSSGVARLRFSGNGVMSGEHDEAIGELARLLDARFVDFEVSSSELDQKPSREIQNLADSYSIFVPKDSSFDGEVLEHYSDQASSYGDIEFLFKVEKTTDEQRIYDIVDEYKIYDWDVWLYPKGRKARSVSERFDIAYDIAKRNTWQHSPRLGITPLASEEIAEAESND